MTGVGLPNYAITLMSHLLMETAATEPRNRTAQTKPPSQKCLLQLFQSMIIIFFCDKEIKVKAKEKNNHGELTVLETPAKPSIVVLFIATPGTFLSTTVTPGCNQLTTLNSCSLAIS